MNDISEAISESVEHASESKLNSLIAICVAITATIMAICNIKGGNIVQAMSQAQSRSVNSWSYFQSKSTKQNLAEGTLEVLRQNKSNVELIKKYEEKITRYEKEKEEIKQKAEGFEKEYDDLNLFDDQFDMTEAFLSIAIALFGVTALTQKKWLFAFALTVSLIGMTLGITAFFKISLHSDLVAKILG